MVSRKFAATLAYAGGALLLLAGATGSTGIIGAIVEYLVENLDGATADLLSVVLYALNFVAGLGGVSVIIGGWLVNKKRVRTGKFVIGLGSGMGLIGFMIILASAFLNGWVNAINFLVLMSQSVGWTGILLSIAATILAK
jgi:hypothetical protein